MTFSTHTEASRLADQLQRSFHGGAWHGPATLEVLAGIDAADAARHPKGSPHSIVEIVRHITFWFNAAHIRIACGDDVDPEADWLKEEALNKETWERAIAELKEAYSKLQGTVLELDDARLDDAVRGLDPTVRGLLLGTLQHSAYHTGEIGQLARELAT